MDYLKKLRNCRTPYNAALYIRAFGCRVASTAPTAPFSSDSAVVSAGELIRQYESHAQIVEADDDMKNVRRMLKEWGYIK